MADTKITALTELAAAPASGDQFVLVDVSDTSMAASGTNKRIQFSNLVSGLVVGLGGNGLSESAGMLVVNVDGSTLEISSDALRIKDLGVTSAKLANLSVTSGKLASGAAVVNLGTRSGWTAATGTADRTTFATSTVTLAELAQHFKALTDDLLVTGLIGA